MTLRVRSVLSSSRLRSWVVMVSVLLGATILGSHVSVTWLVLPLLGVGAIVLLRRPVLGLLTVVPAALVVPIEFGTGTQVVLNAAALLVPVLMALCLLDMVRRRNLRLVSSRTTVPLALLVLVSLLSLLIGNVIWDPAVPRPGGFAVVQMAQWSIFLFSAGAFWLTGCLVPSETWMRRYTLFSMVLAGCVAIVFVLSSQADLTSRGIVTFALHRAPFWMLLAALSGGQLLFNRELSVGWRIYLLSALGASLVYSFLQQRETASNWVGVSAVLGVLSWLRWPRVRWLAVILLVVLVVSGFLTSTVYDFAGGEVEWERSGGSRLVLISRVVEVTMRNPITGLGPAAYRLYARTRPLAYQGALWVVPNVSSHNNYVDLFSHSGLLGVGLFLWFAVELVKLGLHLRVRFPRGFAAGYVNGMLAAWAGALTLMLLADWILPFVYNIGFSGFQASVLVWFFLGGLVALEQTAYGDSTQ